jgi:hypothetical protein
VKLGPVGIGCLGLLSCLLSATAQDNQPVAPPAEKARVFITDSQSWEVAGYAGAGAGAGASVTHGGARPQTAEIIKTFGERCPEVMVNNIQEKADYIVLLDHEGGKGYLRHRNKVAVFGRISGDSIVSKSTLSLGGSVQDACEAINKDWAVRGAEMRSAAAAAVASKVPAPQPVVATPVVAARSGPSTAKLTVVSVPDSADIEIDGVFVGDTPSDVQLPEGEHSVAVKKKGFKDWERKMKVMAGSSVHLNAELETQ